MSTAAHKQQFLDLLEQRAAQYRQMSRDRFTEHPWYKLAAECLGSSPWVVIGPLAFAISIGLIVLFRSHAVRGVSWLQWGF